LPTRPTLRFHGSIPALTEQLKKLMATETRIVLAGPHQGDVERLATVLRDYEIPYRLGSRAPRPGETMMDEGSYLAGDLRVPVIVRSPLAAGVSFAETNLIVFGANDFSDEADVTARPEPKRSKTAAFVSDFRDLGVGDYVVHVEHGIAQYQGLKEITQDGLSVEFMILEFAEGAKLYVPLTRLDLIQKYRSTDTGPAPVLNRLGSQGWTRTKARVRKAMQDMAAELLKLYAERNTVQGTAFSKDNEFQKTPSTSLKRMIRWRRFEPSNTIWNRPRQWTGCSAAMLAMAKPKLPCAPRSRPCRMASRWQSSRPQPCSLSSISRRSNSASPSSLSTSR
jgi:transcription-repair coupling factor (superfamily II helicase)